VIYQLVCKEKENYKHLYLDCKYNKKYWQEVKKMTTNLYIGDHVFNPCALLMKFPVLTSLKIFVSNTLFTSSLKILNISTFFVFD
jgi:hypothetical protein